MAQSLERPNQVSVSDAGPSRKKLSITVPAETVAEKLRESLDTLSHEAALPGFRKGRVPRRLVEKRFGSAVRTEAKNELVAAAYSRAIEEHKLQVISEPTADELSKTELEDGKALSFEVEVEVLPEFELPELNGIKILKPLIQIEEKDVDAELQRVCVTEGTLEERTSAEPGDYLTGVARMELPDGTEFYNINGAVVQAPTPDKQGRGMILGIMVDDFEKQLGLPGAGSTVTIRSVGPQNHEVERLRGLALNMTFKVERIDRIVPAQADGLALRFGYPTTDALKDEIRSRLFARAQVEQQAIMRSQAAKHLIDSTTIALPERMTERQTERNLGRRRLELMYRGIDARHVEEQVSDLRNASHDVAVRELKLYFILHKAADQLKVQVTEGDVNARIAQIAAQRRERPEKLRQELIQSNQIGQIFQQVREHKAVDAILANASVEEVSEEEYEKRMGAKG